MAALLNSLMAVNINNRHLVWRLRTKLDSASTVNKDSKHYKRASNIQKYKCIQPGIEARQNSMLVSRKGRGKVCDLVFLTSSGGRFYIRSRSGELALPTLSVKKKGGRCG